MALTNLLPLNNLIDHPVPIYYVFFSLTNLNWDLLSYIKVANRQFKNK